MKMGILFAAICALQFSNCCLSQSAPSNQQEIDNHTRRAQEFEQAKKPQLAIPELEAVVALDPRNLNAQANLGVLLYFQGEYVKAEPHLHAAVDLQSGLPKIQALLGITQKRIGNRADARVNLEAAFPALENGKFKVQAGMELIELYTASGELELAAQIISGLRRSMPENLEVQYAAYRIYSDLAGDAMLTLSILGPESAQVHQVMAREASRQGNTNVAIANERAAIQVDPHLPGIHLELAELLSASGDSKSDAEAETEYLAAMKENQFDERADCGLARLFARHGKLEGALEYYSAAVALEANDFEANSGMAQTLIELNQESKALPYLEKAVRLEPTDAQNHYRLSRLYSQQKRGDEAKREMALYLKYKDMKKKLSTIYEGLRLPESVTDTDFGNENKK